MGGNIKDNDVEITISVNIRDIIDQLSDDYLVNLCRYILNDVLNIYSVQEVLKCIDIDTSGIVDCFEPKEILKNYSKEELVNYIKTLK